MTDKLTDSEIVKALEDALHRIKGAEHLIVPKEGVDNLCNGLENALDLINRLQAKAIKEQNKNSKLRNERNRLQSQNKDLAETVHNLTIEKDALFDKAEELKVEVERLKESLNIELENFATEYDNKIKAEAYKECIGKVKEYIDTYEHLSCEECECVPISKDGLDNLLKELVGEDK